MDFKKIRRTIRTTEEINLNTKIDIFDFDDNKSGEITIAELTENVPPLNKIENLDEVFEFTTPHIKNMGFKGIYTPV